MNCVHRALLIDDSVDLLDIYSELVRTHGLEPVTAVRADQAWELFRKDTGSFKLVLTERLVPGTPSIDWLVGMIRSASPVPILLVSGDLEPLPPPIGLRCFDAVMPKPFNYVKLSSLVAQLIRG